MRNRILELLFIVLFVLCTWVVFNFHWALRFEAAVMEGEQPVIVDRNIGNTLAVYTHNNNYKDQPSKQVRLF